MHVNGLTERIRTFVLGHFPLAQARDLRNDEQLLGNGIVDSLGILEVVAFLEREFQITVTDEELLPENFQSINDLAAFARSKLNSAFTF